MNVFETEAVIKLALDKYREDLRTAESETKTSSSHIGSTLGNIAKVGAAALLSAATAVTAITKQVVDAYGEYEQLIGGVDKLYQSASQKVQKYAQQAYQTVGISANQYMQQATSFSAALINSLDEDYARAAELTDVAMRAMSDNWNTFGTNAESVMGAFQGFAKQNYTMLDNLKLGYGGTKTEMERLIADANKWAEENGKASDLTIEKYSDVIQAIQLIQEKQHIAGTTAKEAATTIQGSIGSMKAAWQNFLVALGGGGDSVEESLNRVVKSFETVFKNIVPVVQKVADALPKAITVMVRQLPSLFKAIVPAFAKAVAALFDGLLSNLGQILDIVLEMVMKIIEYVADNLPKAIDTIFSAIIKIVEAIGAKLPDLVPRLVVAIVKIIPSIFAGIISAVFSGISGIIEGITGQIDVFGINAQRQLSETNARIRETLDSWNDLKDAEVDAIKVANDEANNYTALWEELKLITDENGKVKEGYESRASFIIDTLNGAIGSEIEMINGEITGYKDLQTEIDNLIEKKRAYAILEAQEERYNEALENRAKIQGEINTKQEQLNQLQEQMAQRFPDYNALTAEGQAAYLDLQNQIENTQSTIDGLEETQRQYYETIASYEYAYKEANNGNYAAITETVDGFGNFLSSNLNDRKKQLEDSLSFEKNNLAMYKALAAEGNEELYQDQITHTEQMIEQYQKQYDETAALIAEANARIEQDQASSDSKKVEQAKKTSKDIHEGYMSDFPPLQKDMYEGGKKAGEEADRGVDDGTDPSSTMDNYILGFQAKSAILNGAMYAIGIAAGNSMNKGTNDSLQIKSPSRKAMRVIEFYTAGGIQQMEKDAVKWYDSAYQLGAEINRGMEDVLGSKDFADGSIDLNGNATVETVVKPETEALNSVANKMDDIEELVYNAVARVLNDGFDLRFNDRELTRVVREHA